LQKAIDRILRDRLENVDSLNKVVSEAIKNITVLLMAIPILLAMAVLGDVMAIISSAIGG
jgi:hypothetical protein